MREAADRRDNEAVYTVEWRAWWHQVRDLLRPEPPREPPSRTALIADTVFAIVLTVVALVIAAKVTGGDQVFHTDKIAVPVRPPRPIPPGAPLPEPPPSHEVHHVPWLLTVLTVLPLAARRRYPLLAFLIIVLAAQAVRENATWITILAYVIAAYAAIAYSRYRTQAI